VRHAALRGRIVFGPDLGPEPTYVALEDWAETRAPVDRDAALVELASRYLHAFGPATPEDLAAWSGLGLGDARAGFAGLKGELLEVQTGRWSAWMPKTRARWLETPLPQKPATRMAPTWDSYLLGYRNRSLAVDEAHARRVQPGAGMIRPTLLVDGHVEGCWRRVRARGRLTITLEPFAPLSEAVRSAVDEEVADIARFLGMDVALTFQPVPR
jgi:hypothetical protein